MFHKTYVVNFPSTIHNWAQQPEVKEFARTNGHQERAALPSDESAFGKKLVRASAPPPNCIGEFEKTRPDNTFGGAQVLIYAQACFSKRARDGIKPESLTEQQALKKFLDLAGLADPQELAENFSSAQRVEEFVVGSDNEAAGKRAFYIADCKRRAIHDRNVFRIKGSFCVQDEQKFLRAYNYGVGRRFSYGCGLIIVL